MGFGGIGSALDPAQRGEGGGGEGGKAKAGAGQKAKDGKRACTRAVAAAATVVLWGHWWQAHWERWQRRRRRGVGGKARHIFKG